MAYFAESLGVAGTNTLPRDEKGNLKNPNLAASIARFLQRGGHDREKVEQTWHDILMNSVLTAFFNAQQSSDPVLVHE